MRTTPEEESSGVVFIRMGGWIPMSALRTDYKFRHFSTKFAKLHASCMDGFPNME